MQMALVLQYHRLGVAAWRSPAPYSRAAPTSAVPRLSAFSCSTREPFCEYPARLGAEDYFYTVLLTRWARR